MDGGEGGGYGREGGGGDAGVAGRRISQVSREEGLGWGVTV